MTKQSIVTAAAIAATLSSASAFAELSANVGVVSDYIFRGITQTSSAAANGGIDWSDESGFYAGIWAINIEGGASTGNGFAVIKPTSGVAGLEIDTYLGYGGEVEDFSYSIGFTHYEYSGDFDTTYDEVNLGAGYGDFSLDIAIGTHENTPQDDDYLWYSLGYSTGPFSVSYNGFGQDADGEYIELGMSTDIGGADAGITLVVPLADSTDAVSIDTKTSMVFSISKSFDL